MPTMRELYDFLKPWADKAEGFSKEAYEYASGNVETLLSYYAIPSPHDDAAEQLHKRRVTKILENTIGTLLRDREKLALSNGLNPNAEKLLVKWHENRSHILTTNYDTLVERIASAKIFPPGDGKKDDLSLDDTDLYPIPVTNAMTRDGGVIFGSGYPDTFTYYKLHGSTTWFKSESETSFDPIYGLSFDRIDDPKYRKFISDKRRFIIPPVYDKSSLLAHESIRNLWWQAKNFAMLQADNLYVIGYSLPETDAAMQTLLWEGSRKESCEGTNLKALYVVDVGTEVIRRYKEKLGRYYDVRDCYAGDSGAFDIFVEQYIGDVCGGPG